MEYLALTHLRDIFQLGEELDFEDVFTITNIYSIQHFISNLPDNIQENDIALLVSEMNEKWPKSMVADLPSMFKKLVMLENEEAALLKNFDYEDEKSFNIKAEGLTSLRMEILGEELYQAVYAPQFQDEDDLLVDQDENENEVITSVIKAWDQGDISKEDAVKGLEFYLEDNEIDEYLSMKNSAKTRNEKKLDFLEEFQRSDHAGLTEEESALLKQELLLKYFPPNEIDVVTRAIGPGVRHQNH